MKQILVYDSTFEGFLSVVYEVFEERPENVSIKRQCKYQADIFNPAKEIKTDAERASRVWRSLRQKLSGRTAMELHSAFLSEINGIEDLLLSYILYAYGSSSYDSKDYSHPLMQRILLASRLVKKEVTRLEQSMHEKTLSEEIKVLEFCPEYNSLPLLTRRLANKLMYSCFLYDNRRKYGYHYDLINIQLVKGKRAQKLLLNKKPQPAKLNMSA